MWRLKWAGHVARMEGMRNAYRRLVEKYLENVHLEDRERDGMMTLRTILDS
jgi:hypothetical protein